MERDKDSGKAIVLNIFDATEALNARFGVGHIASLLVGSNSQKILNYAHNDLAVYSALKEYPLEQVKIWIRELLAAGFLEQSKTEYPVVRLTDKARLVRMGLEKVSLSDPDPNLARIAGQKGESVSKTMELFKQGWTVREIARERRLAQSTIVSHLAQAFERGEEVDINQFVSSEKQRIIAEKFKNLGWEFLSPVRQALGSAFTWEDLKWVRAKLVREQKVAA